MPRLSAARFLAGLLALGIVTAAFVLVPPHDSASALPAPTLSKSTVQRGESFTISGTGCWDPDYDPYGEVGREQETPAPGQPTETPIAEPIA